MSEPTFNHDTPELDRKHLAVLSYRALAKAHTQLDYATRDRQFWEDFLAELNSPSVEEQLLESTIPAPQWLTDLIPEQPLTEPVGLVCAVLSVLTEAPQLWNQQSWVNYRGVTNLVSPSLPELRADVCSTTCCVAGWLVVLSGHRLQLTEQALSDSLNADYDTEEVPAVITTLEQLVRGARHALRLTKSTANLSFLGRLFGSDASRQQVISLLNSYLVQYRRHTLGMPTGLDFVAENESSGEVSTVSK